MTDNLFWRNRIIESGTADPQELAKGYNPSNWRSHPQLQRDALEDALDSIGVLQPVLFNKSSGRVIDGHLRIELAILKGQPLIPVNYVELTDDEEALALATLDAITEQAEPIPDKLAALLERTREMTADRPGLGAMLAALKARAGINGNGGGVPELPPMVDKAEELQAKWQVKPGDLWTFESKATPGRFHRLLCGDCRNPDDMMRLTDGQQVNGVFTSPPYAEQRKAQYGGVPVGEYVEWWGAVQTNVRSVLAEDGSFFVNIKPHCEDGQRSLYVFDLVCEMVRQWGWKLIDELCWVNGGYPGHFSPRFKNGFEPVYHFSFGDVKHRPDNVKFEMTDANKRKTIKNQETYGPGRHYSPTGSNTNRNDFTFSTETALPSNVVQVPADRGFLRDETIIGIHSATFPVALPTFFLRAYSDPGDIWLDPFAGSGTVGVSAENEGRISFMMERLPKYCAVVLERLSTLTHQTPRRVSG